MSRRLRAFLLPVPLRHQETLRALGEAFVASSPWATMPEAFLVVRERPRPRWGVIGWLDDAQAARVEAAAWQIQDSLERLHYIDYPQAEQDCAVLAEKLVDRFGSGIRDARFVAVPRGGLIVAGMLAYTLGVSRAGLSGAATGHDVTLLVDDCALSGARVKSTLESLTEGDVVVVTLYSHPDLRAAVVAAEPRVVDFVSAGDLVDHAPRIHGDDYEPWVARWAERTGDYWIGHPDHVCFAWSEPDMIVWNEVTGTAEAGWYVVPPNRCLKTRTAEQPRLQIQPEPAGPLRPAADVLYATVDDRRLLATPNRPTVVELTGVAADIWDAIVAHGDESAVVAAVADMYDEERRTISGGVHKVVEDLRDRGLLVQGW